MDDSEPEEKDVDPLQQLKALLEKHAGEIPWETRSRSPIDQNRYIMARVLAGLIGNTKLSDWLAGEKEKFSNMTPQQFDAMYEAFERENKLSIVDEIDRWGEKLKNVFASKVAARNAAEKIINDLLAGNRD
jgi:hypothetical protein